VSNLISDREEKRKQAGDCFSNQAFIRILGDLSLIYNISETILSIEIISKILRLIAVINKNYAKYMSLLFRIR